MVVILFHNNDDILLQKYQKEFILKNQSTENILYSQHPIRCTLSKDTLSKLELKELGKTINTITLEKVEWDNESQTLNCNATLHHHDKKQCKLTFPLVSNTEVFSLRGFPSIILDIKEPPNKSSTLLRSLVLYFLRPFL